MNIKMKRALVVGGNSGIGLALCIGLLNKGYSHVYIVGKDNPDIGEIGKEHRTKFINCTTFYKANLLMQEYGIFEKITDIDTLIITAGFGRVCEFENLTDAETENLIKINLVSAVRIIKHYYDKIKSDDPFYCAVMGSIAGHIVSPLFSVYGAAKAGLCAFIENVNTELAYCGFKNRILDVSPGSLKGTKFNGGENNLDLLSRISDEVLCKMFEGEMLFIPDYETIYKGVLQRYNENPTAFGIDSYKYKIERISEVPQVIIGYLSGTFDLFHIGHLNLLRRAKAECDFLIAGVHYSGSWKGKETYIPFEERRQIVESIKYVDIAVKSFTEDSDAYDALHYNKLFVGNDYKNSERFNRYEEYFKDKNVEIVYFPYTQSTSSSQLRDAITK